MKRLTKLLSGIVLAGAIAGCGGERKGADLPPYTMIEGTVIEETRSEEGAYILKLETEKGEYRIQIEDRSPRLYTGRSGTMTADLLDAEIEKGSQIRFPTHYKFREHWGDDYENRSFFNNNSKVGVVDPDFIEIIPDAEKR